MKGGCTPIFEVDVGEPVLGEPIVDLEVEVVGEGTRKVNTVVEGSVQKLLDVKVWLGMQELGMDLLADTDSACNLCKNLGAQLFSCSSIGGVL